MNDKQKAVARALTEHMHEQDCVREEPPNDDGMRMLSSVTVIGLVTLVALWVASRTVVWAASALSAWVTR